jgi:hypothetical protein
MFCVRDARPGPRARNGNALGVPISERQPPSANLLLKQAHLTRHVLDFQVAVSHVALPHAVLRPMGGRHIDVVSEQLKFRSSCYDLVFGSASLSVESALNVSAHAPLLTERPRGTRQFATKEPQALGASESLPRPKLLGERGVSGDGVTAQSA